MIKLISNILLIFFIVFCGEIFAQKRKEGEKKMDVTMIRESPIAGSWYPGRKDALLKEVDKYISSAKKEEGMGKLLALISPHAGYMYSGGVAGFAYKQLEGEKIKTAVIVGPSHRAYFQGIAVYDKGAWRTPLGVVEIDSSLSSEIIKQRPDIIHSLPSAHSDEHSLEIQVPFLQRVIPKIKIVPVMMGEQDYTECQILGEALAKALSKKEDVILIASSDLSHYHPDDVAKKLDKIVSEHISSFDPEGLSKSISEGKCEACGGGPISAVLIAAKKLGGGETKILKYATSGDVTGDRRQVVGYLSAGVWKKLEKSNPSFQMNKEEREELLKIARSSIEKKLKNEKIILKEPKSAILKEKRGAFVTLRGKGNSLRGCIGHIKAMKPLYQTISEMACASAFSDPRFPPLDMEEMKDITIEISVLSPLQKISDPDEVIVGKHGVMIEKGFQSGLFLPQVATEEGWNRDEFLSYLCAHKAGLPPDEWKKKDVTIYVFTAEVFGEKTVAK